MPGRRCSPNLSDLDASWLHVVTSLFCRLPHLATSHVPCFVSLEVRVWPSKRPSGSLANPARQIRMRVPRSAFIASSFEPVHDCFSSWSQGAYHEWSKILELHNGDVGTATNFINRRRSEPKGTGLGI